MAQDTGPEGDEADGAATAAAITGPSDSAPAQPDGSSAIPKGARSAGMLHILGSASDFLLCRSHAVEMERP